MGGTATVHDDQWHAHTCAIWREKPVYSVWVNQFSFENWFTGLTSYELVKWQLIMDEGDSHLTTMADEKPVFTPSKPVYTRTGLCELVYRGFINQFFSINRPLCLVCTWASVRYPQTPPPVRCRGSSGDGSEQIKYCQGDTPNTKPVKLVYEPPINQFA